jgi:hypothetical protein
MKRRSSVWEVEKTPMRAASATLMLSLLVFVGCEPCESGRVVTRDPILDAAPPPQEMLDRVLGDPEVVPQRETGSSPLDVAMGDFGQRLGAALEGAATTPRETSPASGNVRVILFTADWCTWCRPAKQQAVPWLASQGFAVEIADVTKGNRSHRSIATPRSLPAWVFLRNGREVYRQEGGYLPQHLQEAVRKVAIVPSPAVGSWFGPTIRVADALPFVAGTTLKLGMAATISVPANLKWTVSQKPGSIVLSFDPSPQVTVHKILNWRVRLEGVEITPTAVTLQIDNLPDITVKFDWSCPAPSSGADLDAGDDLHSAATPRPVRRERPVLRFVGRTVLFAYRVCSIASFVILLL